MEQPRELLIDRVSKALRNFAVASNAELRNFVESTAIYWHPQAVAVVDALLGPDERDEREASFRAGEHVRVESEDAVGRVYFAYKGGAFVLLENSYDGFVKWFNDDEIERTDGRT